MNITQKILTGLFALLYCSVGFVSVYHSIDFFSISNSSWLGVILACTFEIGQAAVLFSLLTQPDKKVMPWILMGVLTFVQVLGNIFASYKYMMINSANELQYFTDSILFFVKNPNPQYNYVIISYITGAILPIVALCMTGMVVSMIEKRGKEENKEIDVKSEPVKQVKEEPRKPVVQRTPPVIEDEKVII